MDELQRPWEANTVWILQSFVTVGYSVSGLQLCVWLRVLVVEHFWWSPSHLWTSNWSWKELALCGPLALVRVLPSHPISWSSPIHSPSQSLSVEVLIGLYPPQTVWTHAHEQVWVHLSMISCVLSGLFPPQHAEAISLVPWSLSIHLYLPHQCLKGCVCTFVQTTGIFFNKTFFLWLFPIHLAPAVMRITCMVKCYWWNCSPWNLAMHSCSMLLASRGSAPATTSSSCPSAPLLSQPSSSAPPCSLS